MPAPAAERTTPVCSSEPRATGAVSSSSTEAEVTRRQLDDAAAVVAVFNIVTRFANALGFAIPTDAEFDKAAGMMFKRGYA